MIIKVKDFIQGNTAIAYDDGVKCLNEELLAIRKGEDIVLDFQGIEYVITAFLNPVIGDLILQLGIEIMKKVSIVNANQFIIEKIKLVKDGTLLKREDIE